MQGNMTLEYQSFRLAETSRDSAQNAGTPLDVHAPNIERISQNHLKLENPILVEVEESQTLYTALSCHQQIINRKLKISWLGCGGGSKNAYTCQNS